MQSCDVLGDTSQYYAYSMASTDASTLQEYRRDHVENDWNQSHVSKGHRPFEWEPDELVQSKGTAE